MTRNKGTSFLVPKTCAKSEVIWRFFLLIGAVRLEHVSMASLEKSKDSV